MRDRNRNLTREERQYRRDERAMCVLLVLILLAQLLCLVMVMGDSADATQVQSPDSAAAETVSATLEDMDAADARAALEAMEAVEAREPAMALTDDERDMVERVVMAESGNQTLEGQVAVAQCILNTCLATGQSPVDVVLAPKQYADPAPAEDVTDSVREAVAAVFDYGETATPEPIQYFYNPAYGVSRWHEESLVYVTTIGEHKFFQARHAADDNT